MSLLKLPRSVRKYIRLQKALIRRGFFDSQKQQEMIDKLYVDILQKHQPNNQAKKSSDTPIPTTVKNTVSTEAK